jgi:3,2-trans-enoyl-CoA isomerase
MLALCCDYRIMAASTEDMKPTIGLNETKLGIVAPPWLAQLMILTVGHREAEKGLSLGLLYSPEEALQIGLVDQVVPKSEVMKRAKEEALKWNKIPPQARVATKQLTRKKQLDHLLATRQDDIDHFCGFVNDKTVQRNIAMYLESLKKKSK